MKGRGGGKRRRGGLKRTPEITKAFERQVQYRGGRRRYSEWGGGGRKGRNGDGKI